MLAANRHEKWCIARSTKSKAHRRCVPSFVPICLLLSGDVELNSWPSWGSKSKSASVKKMFNIVHLNVCSTLCHLHNVNLQHPDAVAVSESWLGPSISDAEVSLSGYSTLPLGLLIMVEVLLSMLLTIYPCLHCPVVLSVVR